MDDRGTRNAMFVMRVMAERELKCRKIYMFALLIMQRPLIK